MKLSDPQKDAIFAPGNVLVVAGAGAGKTSTLVARALRLVLEDGCPVDRILMVTFTEAAAAEMRQRLRDKITDALAACDSGNAVSESAAKNARRIWIEEQLALLDQAHISTIHGFCLELVRRHFHDFHH